MVMASHLLTFLCKPEEADVAGLVGSAEASATGGAAAFAEASAIGEGEVALAIVV